MRRMARHPRAQQHPARNANDRRHHTFGHPGIATIQRVATLVGPALLLVAGLLTLSGARPLAARASAAISAPPLAHAALRPAARQSGGGPDLRHWQDPVSRTAYSVMFQQGPEGLVGQFTFTLPNGDQIIGGTDYSPDPLQPSPANDNTLIQATGCGDGVSDVGFLIPAGQTVAGAFNIKAIQNQEVAYVLRAHLDASGFMGYATLDYVAAGAYRGALCSESAPYPYVVQAGCDLSQCRDPVASATQDAQHYDDAMVAAARDGGANAWQAVWPLTATFIRGQYSQTDFGAAMAKQEQSVGRITQITETTAPDVQLDVALQPFFSVTQDVTVSKNDQSKVYSVTSYYLLEGEQWQFWFSAS